MGVCCECCVLSGRSLCDELITRPEESYRLWCVVVCGLETSRMRRPWPALDRSATEKKIYDAFFDFPYRCMLCVDNKLAVPTKITLMVRAIQNFEIKSFGFIGFWFFMSGANNHAFWLLCFMLTKLSKKQRNEETFTNASVGMSWYFPVWVYCLAVYVQSPREHVKPSNEISGNENNIRSR